MFPAKHAILEKDDFRSSLALEAKKDIWFDFIAIFSL